MATLPSTATLIAGKYEVLSLLGQGSGGSVYKVRHTELDTVRALKILPQHLGKNPDLAQRFYREARVMARLTAPPHGHPNIVGVLDIGHEAALDSHYFVMEYIRGQTLRDYFRHRGALPLPEVLQMVRQIALALDFAHQQTPPVIHRDIKPANIMLEDDSGRVVVMDFGIAKELGEAEFTKTGVVLGTIRYCAPEQMRHEPLTGAADIYALGMVMYEAYTGQQFFGNLTEHQVIGQLLYDEHEQEPDFPLSTPPAFAAVVRKAIAKNPKHRYAKMQDFLSALQDCSVQTEETQTLLLRNTPSQKTNASHSLDTIEKQIQHLEQERHHLVRAQQSQVQEVREQAEREGASEWASELFQKGLALEGHGSAHFQKREYTLAEAVYREAADLFTQAQAEAITGRQVQDGEHAQRAMAQAKAEAERSHAREEAHTLYGSALALQAQADELWAAQSYAQAGQLYNQAQEVFFEASSHAVQMRKAELPDTKNEGEKQGVWHVSEETAVKNAEPVSSAASPNEKRQWELGTDDFTQSLNLSEEDRWKKEALQGESVEQVGNTQFAQQMSHTPPHGWRQNQGLRWVLLTLLAFGIGSLLWVANQKGGEGFSIVLSFFETQQDSQLGQGKPEGESAKQRKADNARILPAKGQQAAENQGAEIQGYLTVGKLYMGRGKYRQAITEFEKARTLQPENKAVLEHLQAAHSAWSAEKKLGLITDG